jgi:hypothetical protein
MSHQIIGEHEARSLKEFKDALQNEDFIIVEEWQIETNGKLKTAGNLLLNHQHVGKVRIYEPK